MAALFIVHIGPIPDQKIMLVKSDHQQLAGNIIRRCVSSIPVLDHSLVPNMRTGAKLSILATGW